MKVERIVKIYNDLGKELFVGDTVKVTTASGTYEGTLKKIQLNALAVEGLKHGTKNHRAGGSVSIVYKDIINII